MSRTQGDGSLPKGTQGHASQLASSSRSRNVLVHGGGTSYVSQSGLAAVLKQVREHGVPDAISRSSVKRARDRSLPQELWTQVQLVKTDGSVVGFPAIHPWKLLQHTLQECAAFADHFVEKLRQNPNVHGAPWGIAVYSDEVLPGNQLKARNDRKLIAFYWGFVQHGRGLSSEEQWFHICSIRSNAVRECEFGWAQVFKAVCLLFFQPPEDATLGIPLTVQGNTFLFFAKIALVIGDIAALTSCLCLKGASGSKPCVFCQNVTLHGLNLHTNDPSGRLVSHAEPDVSKLSFETNESLAAALALLGQEVAARRSKATIERTEKALGLVHNPDGPLCSQQFLAKLQGGPLDVIQFDWMHLYCVSGILNTELGYLMDSLKTAGLAWKDLDAYLRQFILPKQVASRGVGGTKVLKGYDGGEVKCSASEGLSVYIMFRLMLMQLVPQDAPPDTLCAVQSFYALANVLDLLQQLKLGDDVSPNQLGEAIRTHLLLRIQAYGQALCQPKCCLADGILSPICFLFFSPTGDNSLVLTSNKLPPGHYALHLEGMVRRQPLLTCWVHERKHKELKRFGSDTSNANRTVGYERSLLQSVVLSQLEDMKRLQTFDGIYLDGPAPCDEQLALHVRRLAGRSALEPVWFAKDAFLAMGRMCGANDVALVNLRGSESVAQVWFHVQVGPVNLSCVSAWIPAGPNLFQKQDAPEFIPTSMITRCLMYRPTDSASVMAVAP